MITNERQYRIAKARVAGADRAITEEEAKHAGKPPIVREAFVGSLRGNLQQLLAEIDEYEQLRSGSVELRASGLSELPQLLIKARVAHGWTQRRLAERLRVPEQQVQRWEAHEYHGVGIERLAEISDALGVTVEERFVATAI